MSVSELGEIRHDPTSGAVAIRTNQPEEPNFLGKSMAWLVATPTMGAKFVGSDVVADWTILVEVGE